jgi:hypothetical protein
MSSLYLLIFLKYSEDIKADLEALEKEREVNIVKT